MTELLSFVVASLTYTFNCIRLEQKMVRLIEPIEDVSIIFGLTAKERSQSFQSVEDLRWFLRKKDQSSKFSVTMNRKKGLDLPSVSFSVWAERYSSIHKLSPSSSIASRAWLLLWKRWQKSRHSNCVLCDDAYLLTHSLKFDGQRK